MNEQREEAEGEAVEQRKEEVVEEEINLLSAHDERQVATGDNVRRDTLMFGQRGLANVSSKCLNRSE